MAKDDALFTRIEAFLNGEMTPEERSAFEREIESDASLAEEVELQRDTHALLRLHQQTVWKEKLKALETKIEAGEEKKLRRISLWSQTYVRIAAAILLLVIAGYFFIRGSYNSQYLLSEAFAPYGDIVTVKGESDAADIVLSRAMDAYNRQKYEEAIPLFRQLPGEEPHAENARFYLAISLMATGKPSEALPLLESFSDADSKFSEAAIWYAALACLQIEVNEACIQRLEALAGSGSFFAGQAEALLGKLNSFWRVLPGV